MRCGAERSALLPHTFIQRNAEEGEGGFWMNFRDDHSVLEAAPREGNEPLTDA